jgi:hypothetical protein
MEAKTFEIRDRATFIPALAVHLKPLTNEDVYLLARSGYGRDPADQAGYVLLMRLDGGRGNYNCSFHEWDTRTMMIAHKYIIQEWPNLHSGDVIDVEYIAGMTAEPKLSERITAPL